MTVSTREIILSGVRTALGRTAASPVAPVPGRVAARTLGDPAAARDALLLEIAKLGGKTQCLGPADLRAAFAALLAEQHVRKATLWQTPGLARLGVANLLADLGVTLVSPHAGKYALAECDLGVTEADAAFPETGTLLLRSTPERPRMVSLVPRIHLAIVDPAVIRGDLSPAFAAVKGEGYWVFVTGPSRTADIELTVTIGVHGPQALYVWALADSIMPQRSPA